LVQSVSIQFYIGEDVLTTLNSGCCWVVWTATARITGNFKRHAFYMQIATKQPLGAESNTK